MTDQLPDPPPDVAMLIHEIKFHYQQYSMVPLNEYQLANMLGFFKRSQRSDCNNGDWFGECPELFRKALLANLDSSTVYKNNFGDEIPVDFNGFHRWLNDLEDE